MAIPSVDTRKLILPWDDAGILGEASGYLKIPDDIALRAGWIFAPGPDKTHVLSTDASGNLNVAVKSSVSGASTVGLLDHNGNPITNTNPLPVSQHSAAVAYVSASNTVNVNGTGGTTILDGLVANLKITLFSIIWQWQHTSTTYPQAIHFWFDLKGNTSATTYRLYEAAYNLAADPGNSPIVTIALPFNPPIELAKVMNGSETTKIVGFCDTQQISQTTIIHGYV